MKNSPSIYEFPLRVPVIYSDGRTNEVAVFETKEEFIEYIQTQIKLPGEYNLKNSKEWQAAYRFYQENESYCLESSSSLAYKKFWEFEKEKTLCGVIIDGFYIPPFYYFYLNYAQIFIKEKKDIMAPAIWDSDYHFFLYILMCILKGKHAIVVKTRQRGYSYKIMMILFWSYCWFRGSINTIGASDISYVIKSWEYMSEYRDHLNTKTPWKRGPHIPKTMSWIERNLTENGDWYGLKSKLIGTTFQQNATKGVGGYQSFFFYEEAGIAPTLAETIGYIRSTVTAGDTATGTIIVSGSVGDLEDCEDLKKLFYKPEENGFLGVKNIWDENPEQLIVGFFVPDTWSFVGAIDEEGNSLIDLATKKILAQREEAKRGNNLEAYRLEISQHPFNPKEAFDWRKTSYFPAHIIGRQIDRLTVEYKENKKPYKRVELYENAAGKVVYKELDITEGFPVITKLTRDMEVSDPKEGCVVIAEPPDDNPGFLQYFAGVDPIATDTTTTSESLFCIYIFKNLVETRYKAEDSDEIKTKLSGYKPVAWYIGRREDIAETNKIGEYLLRLYNARAVIESNVQNFINHMQNKNLHRYMFPKEEIQFLADLKANENVHKQYGAHMTPTIKNYMLSNIKEYVSEIQGYERKFDPKKGTDEIVMTHYGVERLVDEGLLNELKAYADGMNADRLVAFGLALSQAKQYMIHSVIIRKNDVKEEKVIAPLPRKSFFKTLDGNLNPLNIKKSFFKYHG